MSVVEDFQQILKDAGVVDGGTGWTSFRRVLPDEPDDVVVITEAGGPDPEAGTGVEQPFVQVRTRAKRPSAARTKLDECIAALAERTEVTVNGTRYAWIYRSGEVAYLGLDEEKRASLAQTFSTLR